jgi:hypothetical protein
MILQPWRNWTQRAVENFLGTWEIISNLKVRFIFSMMKIKWRDFKKKRRRMEMLKDKIIMRKLKYCMG